MVSEILDEIRTEKYSFQTTLCTIDSWIREISFPTGEIISLKKFKWNRQRIRSGITVLKLRSVKIEKTTLLPLIFVGTLSKSVPRWKTYSRRAICRRQSGVWRNKNAENPARNKTKKAPRIRTALTSASVESSPRSLGELKISRFPGRELRTRVIFKCFVSRVRASKVGYWPLSTSKFLVEKFFL